MNNIKRKTVEEFIRLYPGTETGLRGWLKIHQLTVFNSIMDLKKAYLSADYLKGSDYICINIKGNDYRLILRYAWGKTVFIIDFYPTPNIRRSIVEEIRYELCHIK